jgi:sugar phosphate isomerase/epimerase
MKLSFSTLGAPDWSFDEILKYAREYGYDGVGFRGVKGQMDLTRIPEFLPENRKATLKRFRDAGLEIMMMLTGAKFVQKDKSERDRNVADARANIDLAADMAAGTIRIFGGAIPADVKKEDAIGWVVDCLKASADYGAKKKIRVLIEVHDAFTDTFLVREVMERVNHPWAGVLWDVHHPYRTLGQSMKTAWDNVGRWTYDTHFKDSVVDKSDLKYGHRYTLMGDGDVPNIEALQLLKDAGYKGYLTFEWEKAWHPALPDAHVAFPDYVTKMKGYLARLK